MKDYGINAINLEYGHNPSTKLRECTCPICGSNFTTTNSRRKYCSEECSKTAKLEQSRRWKKDNHERYLKLHKDYYERHKEEHKVRHKKYYEKHKEYFKTYQKNYYWKHRDKMLEYKHNYYKEHYSLMSKCKVKHDNCFNCPTLDGNCLYE